MTHRPSTPLRWPLAAALMVVAAVVLVSRADAHHAFAAEFDANSPVLLRGKITKVEWINPHAWVHMVVEEKDKPARTWAVEGGTPNTMLRAGITRDTLKIGTEIIVRGYQSKDHHCEPHCKANGRDVTFADGRKVFMGSSGTGAPKDGSDPTDAPAK